MNRSFGSKGLQECLEKLGFVPRGIESSHLKYYHKQGKIGSKPFMIVQLGKKTYGHNAANRYMAQIKKFGFTKEEIEKNL